MIPSQKLGIDTPHSETPLASTSHAVLRRTAAIHAGRDGDGQGDQEREAGQLDRDRAA